MLRVYKKTGQARDEGVSIKRSSTLIGDKAPPAARDSSEVARS